MLQYTIVLTGGLLVALVALAAFASRLQIPYAIALVLGGALLGFIPALPRVMLEPELVLLLFLPPLIFSSAWSTSWRNFRRALLPILFLAIGLVLFTMLCVAVVAHMLVNAIPWSVAFVLGAVVAPTDSVAATAVIQRLDVSRRIETIIEGESLVNDATALVAYNFAVAAVVNATFALGNAGLQFFVVSLGGIVIGLLIAWLATYLLKHLNHTPSEITITILAPFAAYLLAETLGISGVLATAAVGLYLGRQSAIFYSADTRMQSESFWNVLTFLLNGLMFLLVGLQLRNIVDTISSNSLLALFTYAAAISLTVILVRLAWSFAAIALVRLINRLFHRQWHVPNGRATLVVGWSGMRGGVSLATALALPATIASGLAFPQRDLVIFLTFCAIFVTLTLQGLTMEPLIRRLNLGGDTSARQEFRTAEKAISQAAISRIDALSTEDWVPEGLARRLKSFYERKLDIFTQDWQASDRMHRKGRRDTVKKFFQEVRSVQRDTAIKLRNTDEIDDKVFHRIERDLDIEEQRFQEA